MSIYIINLLQLFKIHFLLNILLSRIQESIWVGSKVGEKTQISLREVMDALCIACIQTNSKYTDRAESLLLSVIIIQPGQALVFRRC